MRFLSSIRLVRLSLALAVAFWMAGAGCLLGCGNMVSAASSEVASSTSSPLIVAAGDACASMQSHDCCARHRAHAAAKPAAHPVSEKLTFVADAGKKIVADANDELKFIGQLPATMMDCPLAINATAALSKAGSDQANVALPASSDSASLGNSTERTSTFAAPLRLPNRGHTYLRCCVFLI
jgi:hypothetical protein